MNSLQTFLIGSALLSATFIMPQTAHSASINLAQLRCELRSDPIGVDIAAPRLSWNLTSSARGVRQEAYHILVASSSALLAKNQGDLWDSGLVQSSQSLLISYAGKPLRSAQQVFWKVQVRSGGAMSPWSAPGQWTMGLLSPADWKARWISAPGADMPERKSIGYHAGQTRQQNEEKWIQVDLGRAQTIESVRLHPMNHVGIPGFGFPLRFKIETSNDVDFGTSTILADQTAVDFANPGAAPVTFAAKNASARFVRVTVQKLAPHPTIPADFAFALSQLEVMTGGKNVALNAPVSAKDSVENFGWGKAGLTDGAILVSSAAPSPHSPMLLRREFQVKPRLRRALAFVSGLGHYEMTVNGQRASPDLLEPGWTNYRKTVLYGTYDITSLLKSGAANAVGLSLGHGMYDITDAPDGRYVKFRQSFGPLQAIAQLRFEYADGSTETVGTDENWRVGASPVTFDNEFAGEDYDARLETIGWDSAGLRANANWKTPAITSGPGGAMRGLSCAAPPIRRHDVLAPVKITHPKPGVAVYDFGQNAAMMPRLVARGGAGSRVRMIPAELVGKDGLVDRASATQDGVRPAWWQLTLKGQGSEAWFPQFFYQGARFLQVETLAAPDGTMPTVEKLESVVIHSSATPIGHFSSSSELFNRTYELVRWAQRSNMMSVMTDCPHREKLPWLEETHLNGPSLRYNFDMSSLLAKTVNDMADSQLENGFIPNIAPEYFKAQPEIHQPFRNSPEWGSAFLLVPWQQYQFTGDDTLLRRHYEAMKRYVAFLGSTAKNNIVSVGLGDWYDMGPKPPWGSQLTPPPLTATAFYYHDNWILARIAERLNKPEEAQQFDARARDIRAAFNAQFLNAQTGQYATGSQTSNAIPLVMELAEPSNRPQLLEAIVKDIRGRDNSLTSGDVGYRYLLRALADAGRSDVVFDMNNQSNRPGYGMQLARGATSLTEKWDASVGSFGSQNHFMLGQINEWFFHDLAGIQCDPTGPGFRKIIIRPAIVGDLTNAGATFNSPYGLIESRWTRANGKLTLKITIPANTSATVYLPTSDEKALTEGGKPVAQSEGVKVLKRDGNAAVIAVGSGTYNLAAPFSG